MCTFGQKQAEMRPSNSAETVSWRKLNKVNRSPPQTAAEQRLRGRVLPPERALPRTPLAGYRPEKYFHNVDEWLLACFLPTGLLERV